MIHIIGRILLIAIKLSEFIIVLCLISRLFLVDVYTVPHNGMAPTLMYGDKVAAWRLASIDRGDVVVCNHPAEPDKLVVSRVLAIPGQTIQTDLHGVLFVEEERILAHISGSVFFNDVTTERQYTMVVGECSFFNVPEHKFFLEQGTSLHIETFQVNKGVYLLGDNWSDPSDDSREIGEIDPNLCKGQIFMRLMPAPYTGDDIHHGYLAFIR